MLFCSTVDVFCKAENNGLKLLIRTVRSRHSKTLMFANITFWLGSTYYSWGTIEKYFQDIPLSTSVGYSHNDNVKLTILVMADYFFKSTVMSPLMNSNTFSRE